MKSRLPQRRKLEVREISSRAVSSSAVAPVAAAVSAHVALDVGEALQTVRQYLDMDVAFVSQFTGSTRTFRYVDSKLEASPIRVGDSLPITAGYCDKVVDGRLPAIIPDTSLHPVCRAIDATYDMPIGSHLSVPLRLSDGQLYGTFCCFNYKADASLNERDLRLMRMFGTMITSRLDADRRHADEYGTKADRLRAAMRRGEPALVYQPAFRLRDGLMMGVEALARFPEPPLRTPDRWFAEAAEVGLKVELEVQAIRNAIAGFHEAWRHRSDLRLAVNASPDTILSPALRDLWRSAPVERIALEITEHEQVDDYPQLGAVLRSLRQRGCKIAVDDAGSGYASLRHILQIEPDVIKLDISLVRGIDASAGKRALAGGLIEFARQTQSVIIAEGVETEDELATLRALRVNSAQGYLLARPSPAADLCRRLAKGGEADVPIVPYEAVGTSASQAGSHPSQSGATSCN